MCTTAEIDNGQEIAYFAFNITFNCGLCTSYSDMTKDKKNAMHPRNIFRTPPDYTALAIKYKNFRKVCKLDLAGKVIVNYRNEDVLRALTQMLFQEYFQINDVRFAPGSLVPTLPLRLNYILWLEDLLHECTDVPLNVCGIDIGCGSSCIYSLLGAKKNSWEMFALESNEINIRFAKENVERNGLSQLVHIFTQNNKQSILHDFFASTFNTRECYNFCLCNPPFYDSSLADPFNANTRNPEKRPPPNNCHTGRTEELACEGGEVRFVGQIIEESLLYKKNVRIYTSMLGLKTSLSKILNILQEHAITNITTTTFVQGKTTRWGVAWSFDSNTLLAK